VADDPHQPPSCAPVLNEPERQTILSLGIGDFSRPAPDRPLHEFFEAQAESAPARLALEYADERIEYRELNARANHLARALQSAGVAAGEIVGVCIDRSPELIIALLGILKSGAAFLPLDRAFPTDRLQFMLDEAQASIVVTRSSDAAALEGFGGQRLLLDALAGSAESDVRNLGVSVAPEALAYVLYTSGSTGRPKGVMVPQGALVNHMLWMLDAGLVTPDDRVLQKTPISFDVALWECFAPLLAGATIVLAEPSAHRDPRLLVEAIAERRITVTGFVPSMLRHIVEEPGLLRCVTLRRVFSAGEALTLDLARQFAARSGAELYNLYGPTETTIHSTAWRYDPSSSRVSIGRPISRTRIYVLEAYGDLAPLGVAGELCISGSGVALGYLGREDLTAAAFVPDPFSGEDSIAAAPPRMYRTGDFARLLPDGTLECLGRRDRQIKLRGFRIELGEIEAVIAGNPRVREAAVTALDLGEAGPSLAAYVALRSGESLEALELRKDAAKQLADYMLPALWIGLRELPKTTSGKIDYRALPAPADTAASSSARPGDLLQRAAGGEERELSETEQRLARIWERLLGTKELGHLDDFFDLGGHSLLALRLVAEIEREFGKKILLETIMSAPMLAHVALAVEGNAVPMLSPVTAFNRAGSRTPFIFFHNIAGGSVYCRKIAEGIGADQPFYAIDPQGQRAVTLGSIQAMAADYLPLVRSIQAHGPYRLGGFCGGGNVAYEIAQLLRCQGETVARLILVNTPLASARVPWIDNAIHFVGRQRWLGPDVRWRTCRMLALRLRRLHLAFSQGPGVGLSLFADQLAILRNRPRAGGGSTHTDELAADLAPIEHTYHPKPYGDTLTLLWGEEEPSEILHDTTMGWETLARSVTVIPIPGDHMWCIQNAGSVIGERIREDLVREIAPPIA
jgi:amino acid adenylation domain-containing protein